MAHIFGFLAQKEMERTKNTKKSNENGVKELTASVDYLQMIMNSMPEFGLDPEKIYKEAGFDVSILDAPGARIPADQFVEIWDAVEKNNTDPNLGLLLGEKIITYPAHILYMLMSNAPTISDTIDKLSQYFNLLANFHTPCLTKSESHASLAIHYNSDEFEITRHGNEGILSTYATALRHISQRKIQFNGVYFVHSRPEEISEHQRIFNAPIFFDQPENKLIFEIKYLTLPVFLSNKNILETLEKLATKLQEKIFNYRPWSKKVSQVIMDRLNAGKADIESIARKLAVSPRNLQNRLKQEGATYQQLLDDIRKEQAIYLLEKDNISIIEIAFLLGYSDQSVFGRAFKRWVGSTPGQYRSRFK